MAEPALAQEPLRESAATPLARALAASGDTVAAPRTVDGLRSRLAEEVGVGLSAEVLDFETRLQRGEPLPGPVRRAVVPPTRPAFEGLGFIGRDEELQALLSAVAGPVPATVMVSGSAGTGKSRLLAEAAARSQVAVVSARAFLPERNEPWSLARSLLREALA